MQFLSRLSIRARFLGLIIVFVVSSVLVMAFGLRQVHILKAETAEQVGTLKARAAHAGQLGLAGVQEAVRVDRALRTALLAPDATVLVPADRPQSALHSLLVNIQKPALPAGNVLPAELAPLLKRHGNLYQLFGEQLEDPDAAQQSHAAISTVEQQLTGLLEQWVSTVRQGDPLSAGAALSHEQQAMLWMSMISLLGLVVAVIVAQVISRSVSGPLNQMAECAERIADMDLTVNLPETEGHKDELSRLNLAMRELTVNVTGSVQRIGELAGQLASYSSELQANSESSSRELRAENSDIEHIFSATQTMTKSAQAVARNTSHAAQSARGADEEAHAGAQSLQNTIADMSALAEDLNRSGQVIHELESRVQSVGGILRVIREIAEQTNLLALNAAIEAARAGEQGRGFAVVADEVRTLAGRTQDATVEIQNTIGQVRETATQAVTVMEDNRQRVRNTLALTEQTGTSFNNISRSVGRISEMNTQVAESAEAQNELATDMEGRVGHVRDLSHAATEHALANLELANGLANLATRLRDEVGRFRS